MTAAKLVLRWYESHRDNDDHPFTIPQPALLALAVAVREEFERAEAERDTEQLAPPTDEEES